MHNSPVARQSRRGARPHVRWLVGGLLAVGFVFGARWGNVDAGTGKALAVPNLTGDWVSDKGEVIHIDFINLTGRPLVLNSITKGADCKYGGTRGSYFASADFTDANTMHGQMWACTGTKVLVDKCGVDPVFKVDYTTTSISKTSIIGTYTSEWYAPQDGDDCKFTRDPSGDTQKPFQLIRTNANPCPDTAAIKQYSQVSNRAVGNIAFISSHLPQLAGQVATGARFGAVAAQYISRGLGEIVAAVTTAIRSTCHRPNRTIPERHRPNQQRRLQYHGTCRGLRQSLSGGGQARWRIQPLPSASACLHDSCARPRNLLYSSVRQSGSGDKVGRSVPVRRRLHPELPTVAALRG